jgi:hypothetical protein
VAIGNQTLLQELGVDPGTLAGRSDELRQGG